MMMTPLRKKGTPSSQTSQSTSVPAPTGGWNAKDPLANMRADQAIRLDNFFPRTDDVILRPGAVDHVTGISGAVRTLMAFNGTTSQKLFAVTDSSIYDVTTAGVVGAAVASTSLGVYSHVNFNTLGGNYLIAVNGVNDQKLFNGTTWTDINSGSTPSITGVPTADLIAVSVFKRRLWYLRKNSMSAYYLPVDQIGGALVEFPLGQLATLGGKLTAIGTWTIDGGDGADDHLVFVTSRGEVLIYRGVDPSSATDFALVGVYYIGQPVGEARSVKKFGGDLLLMTETGLYPLSKALQSSTVNRQVALSANIQQPITIAASTYAAYSGWQLAVLPQVNALMVNVPVVDQSSSVQFVMNTLTGAWCRFLNWDAFCFELFQDRIFYGTTGKVVECWTGNSDFGANIVGDGRQAFNYFGQRGRQKHIKMIRPILLTNGNYSYSLTIDADFEDLNEYVSLPSLISAYGIYDVSQWDNAIWAPDLEVRKIWLNVPGKPGYALSSRLRVASNSASVSWVSSDYVLELGGIL